MKTILVQPVRQAIPPGRKELLLPRDHPSSLRAVMERTGWAPEFIVKFCEPFELLPPPTDSLNARARSRRTWRNHNLEHARELQRRKMAKAEHKARRRERAHEVTLTIRSTRQPVRRDGMHNDTEDTTDDL